MFLHLCKSFNFEIGIEVFEITKEDCIAVLFALSISHEMYTYKHFHTTASTYKMVVILVSQSIKMLTYLCGILFQMPFFACRKNLGINFYKLRA